MEDLLEGDQFPLEFDLPCPDTRQIEQVIDEPREALALPLDDPDEVFQFGTCRHCLPNELQ